MRVMGGLVGIAKEANGFDHGVLGIALARVDDVVDGFDAAEVGMIGFAVLGRDPTLVVVGITEEFLVSEVAAEETELPEMIGDVFADVADGSVGAYDDLGVFVGT